MTTCLSTILSGVSHSFYFLCPAHSGMAFSWREGICDMGRSSLSRPLLPERRRTHCCAAHFSRHLTHARRLCEVSPGARLALLRYMNNSAPRHLPALFRRPHLPPVHIIARALYLAVAPRGQQPLLWRSAPTISEQATSAGGGRRHSRNGRTMLSGASSRITTLPHLHRVRGLTLSPARR